VLEPLALAGCRTHQAPVYSVPELPLHEREAAERRMVSRSERLGMGTSITRSMRPGRRRAGSTWQGAGAGAGGRSPTQSHTVPGSPTTLK